MQFRMHTQANSRLNSLNSRRQQCGSTYLAHMTKLSELNLTTAMARAP